MNKTKAWYCYTATVLVLLAYMALKFFVFDADLVDTIGAVRYAIVTVSAWPLVWYAGWFWREAEGPRFL